MRLPTLTYEQLTPRQQETWKKHAERRDKPVGPYLTWLHSPDLMDKVSPLSNYFRFDCNLPVKLREFGILVTARFWTHSTRGTRMSKKRARQAYPTT